MSDIFDTTVKSLGAAINFRQTKNSVINSNIANAETPGYHAKKMDFEGALSRAIDIENRQVFGSHPEDIAIGKGSISRLKADVYDNPDVNVSNDGNTVDMEREMAALAENTILYKAAVQLINKKLGGLKYAVTDGGR